jgi:VIT1/CCC1 family predicted Fe2+/Mn2+ transporter
VATYREPILAFWCSQNLTLKNTKPFAKPVDNRNTNMPLKRSRRSEPKMAEVTKIGYGAIKVKAYDGINYRAEESLNTEHLGAHRSYWRDIILGVNDGLISTFLLVVGVVGSGLSPTDILLTAIAGALAGAVSMSAGEFVATKCQNEVLQGEIHLERSHIRYNKQDEISEVAHLLEIIGIPPSKKELREKLIAHYDSDPEALLKIMIALEFGVVEEEKRSPLAAAATSGMLFFVGSLPSVLPFVNREQSSKQGLITATIATTLSLLLVGGIKTWATRGNWFSSAIENLLIAGLGGVLAYGVGLFSDRLLH